MTEQILEYIQNSNVNKTLTFPTFTCNYDYCCPNTTYSISSTAGAEVENIIPTAGAGKRALTAIQGFGTITPSEDGTSLSVDIPNTKLGTIEFYIHAMNIWK